jgi:hypothetical protein
MGIAFFALALFLSIENYFDKPGKKSILFLIVSCSLMILSKISGIIILGGFGLYVLLKREKDISKRIKCIFYLSIGALITAPWFIKNYILTGKIYLPNFTPPLISLHPFSAYVDYAVKTFHYFWEIPLPSKVNLGNIASSLYFCYYAAALIITLALSCLIIFAIVKYCKKYWQYLLITAPLASFCFYWAFLIFWGPHDVGRYSFPLWIFLFLFPVKLIGDMPSKKRKYLCYALIGAFCMVSVVSACGITLHINSIDSQVVKIAETLKKQSIYDVETKLISNDEFTTCALSFYIERRVIFNMPQNVRDTNVSCTGEQIFSSKNFKVFKEYKEYRICRY